jgi:threonine/homoserine/homoserine lactone efflux protein
MLEGITAGFILSLSLFPGTVWLARVGYAGQVRQVVSVGAGFWLSQLLWLFFAVPGLMMMCRHLSLISPVMYVFGAFVLLYMSFKFFRARRVEQLEEDFALPEASSLFRRALVQSFAMPMRLPAAMAILLATGVYINHPPDWSALPRIFLGVLIGVSWWWGQFTALALFFVKRVPEEITLKSLNKIRPFCGLLFIGLAAVSLFLGL